MTTWARKTDARAAGAELTISNEPHVVGAETGGLVFLTELPLQSAPSTVTVTRGGVAQTEVATAPAAGQFRVHYSGLLGGSIEFPSAVNGQTVLVSYKGTGSTLFARDLNNLQDAKADIDGSMPFTGPITVIPNGSAAAPAIVFQGSSTGFYRNPAGAIVLSINGVNALIIDANGITVTGTVVSGVGVAAPVFTSVSLTLAQASITDLGLTTAVAVARDQNGSPMSPQPTFAYSSSAPSVATVGATSGTIVGQSAGTTTITASATIGGVQKQASQTLTVTANSTATATASVTVGTSPSSGTLSTVTLTAGARAYPNPTDLTTVTRIARTFVGASRQFTGIARDAAGNVLYDLAATVTLADSTKGVVTLRHSEIGTVEGEVTGLQPGLTSLSLSIGGVVSNLSILVEAAEVQNGVTFAMPDGMDTSYRAPSANATVLTPMNFTQLKAAFAHPALNTIIIIDKAAADAGAYDSGKNTGIPSYDVNLRMLSTPGTRGTVVIRGSNWASLGDPEATLTAAQEALLPKLTFNQGSYGWIKILGASKHVRIQGINLERGTLTSASDSQSRATPVLVQVGSAGDTDSDETATVGDVDDILIEKCRIAGPYYDGTQELKPDVRHGVVLRGSRLAVVRSRVVRCESANIDTTLVSVANRRAGSTGIFHVEDNFLGFASEPLGVGGYANWFPNMVPMNVSVVGNYCDKGIHNSMQVGSAGGTVRAYFVSKVGFFEAKIGQKILVEGNYAHYQPVGDGGQDGSPYDVKVTEYTLYYATNGTFNGAGTASSDQTTTDVVIRFNVWDEMAGGGQYLGAQPAGQDLDVRSSHKLARVCVHDNIHARPLPGVGFFSVNYSSPSVAPTEKLTDLYIFNQTRPLNNAPTLGFLGATYVGYPNPPENTWAPDQMGTVHVFNSVVGPSTGYPLTGEGAGHTISNGATGSVSSGPAAVLADYVASHRWDNMVLVGQAATTWTGAGTGNLFPSTLAATFAGDVLTASGVTDTGLDAYATVGAYVGSGARVPQVKARTASARALVPPAGPAPTLQTIVVSPDGATLGNRGTQQFTAAGVGSDGQAYALSGNVWSVTSGGGTINASTGLYTAPDQDAVANVVVRCTNGAVYDEAGLTVAAYVAPGGSSSALVAFTGSHGGGRTSGAVANVAALTTFSLQGRVSAQSLLDMAGANNGTRWFMSITDEDITYRKLSFGIRAIDGDGTTYFNLAANAGQTAQYGADLYPGTVFSLNGASMAGLAGTEMLDWFIAVDPALSTDKVSGALYRADGTVLGTVVSGTAGAAVATNAPVGIVHVASGYDLSFATPVSGKWDYAAIRTDTPTTSTARRTKPTGSTSGVIHLWDFTEGTGTTAADSVSGGAALTLTGATWS